MQGSVFFRCLLRPLLTLARWLTVRQAPSEENMVTVSSLEVAASTSTHGGKVPFWFCSEVWLHRGGTVSRHVLFSS